MAGKVLLTLKERPSFEGELVVCLVEERDSKGQAEYLLVCEKKPPFNAEEMAALSMGLSGSTLGDDLEEITKSIGWQQDIPQAEVKEILDVLERQVFPAVPERQSCLEGRRLSARPNLFREYAG